MSGMIAKRSTTPFPPSLGHRARARFPRARVPFKDINSVMVAQDYQFAPFDDRRPRRVPPDGVGGYGALLAQGRARRYQTT